jgi:hypothetical protein
VDIAEFRASLTQAAPPEGISLALQGMWWDARGDWPRAHECAQAQPDRDGDAVHAYLHRVEGDLANAAYWYRRAGRAEATGDLAAEWQMLVSELLAR